MSTLEHDTVLQHLAAIDYAPDVRAAEAARAALADYLGSLDDDVVFVAAVGARAGLRRSLGLAPRGRVGLPRAVLAEAGHAGTMSDAVGLVMLTAYGLDPRNDDGVLPLPPGATGHIIVERGDLDTDLDHPLWDADPFAADDLAELLYGHLHEVEDWAPIHAVVITIYPPDGTTD